MEKRRSARDFKKITGADIISPEIAAVAELADAYGSGPYEISLMWVQLPPAAFFSINLLITHRNFLCVMMWLPLLLDFFARRGLNLMNGA